MILGAFRYWLEIAWEVEKRRVKKESKQEISAFSET